MNRYIAKAIEHKLFSERAIKQAVADARLAQDTRNSEAGAGSGHAFISDPTANQAIKHSTPISSVNIGTAGRVDIIWKPEKWLQVIGDSYAAADPLVRNVAAMRFRDGKAVVFVAMHYKSSTQSVYNWCNEFIQGVAVAAAAKGLIRINKEEP